MSPFLERSSPAELNGVKNGIAGAPTAAGGVPFSSVVRSQQQPQGALNSVEVQTPAPASSSASQQSSLTSDNVASRRSGLASARALWRLPLLALGLNLSEASELAALLEESLPQLKASPIAVVIDVPHNILNIAAGDRQVQILHT